MLNLAKNFWKELNKIRYIEISYGTDEEENEEIQDPDFSIDKDCKKLNKDFNKRVKEIQTNKRAGIIEKLSCFHSELELSKTGLILTKKQRYERAEADLKNAIINGKIDFFYNFIK